MNWELGVRLAEALAWPVFALTLLLVLRRPIANLIERIREFEGPVSLKAKLDRAEIAKIVAKGEKEGAPAEVIAQRILEQSIVDVGERRILRALLDEEDGRYIAAYKGNYPDAINHLQTLGYVRKERGRFFLTETGKEAAKTYMLSFLNRQDAAPGGSI